MLIEYNGTNLIQNGILYFYSSWISECNIPRDNINNLITKHKNINILKINTTKYYKMKSNYNIKTIPSFVLIENSKEISRIDGMSNKITLNQWILENINNKSI